MTDARIQELTKRSGALFSAKAGFDSLNQELADNFYPERADFTSALVLGEDYANALMSSFPVMCRRDLGNMLSSMLRPPEAEWFKVKTQDATLMDNRDVAAWCEYATGVMRRAMYERKARFVRATKEGDHDFVTFGNGAITVEMNTAGDGLLFRCWHLRDLAWAEGPEGEIDTVFRKWCPTARNLVKQFKAKNCHPEAVRVAKETPDKPINCIHVIMPSDEWEWTKKPRNADKFPFVCLYVDCDNQHVMEELPRRMNPWVIPRWQTVSGSQYGFSAAAIVMLPDARLLQIQTLVILEQGEKSNDPPMVAKRDIFQSSPNLFAGGITYADMEGDEKLSDILEVLQPDRAGHVTGMELIQKTEKTLNDGFFLNRLFLPPPDEGEKMTAYEVQRRTQEFIRQALPLFEPVESEYNTPICEKVFELLSMNRAFKKRPQIIATETDMEFEFESPLKQAKGRADVQRFTESAQLSTIAREVFDPALPDNVDSETAFRDAMRGIGASATWQRDRKQVEAFRERREQAQAAQKVAEVASQAATVGQQVGDAAQSLRAGGVLPPMQEAA